MTFTKKSSIQNTVNPLFLNNFTKPRFYGPFCNNFAYKYRIRRFLRLTLPPGRNRDDISEREVAKVDRKMRSSESTDPAVTGEVRIFVKYYGYFSTPVNDSARLNFFGKRELELRLPRCLYGTFALRFVDQPVKALAAEYLTLCRQVVWTICFSSVAIYRT